MSLTRPNGFITTLWIVNENMLWRIPPDDSPLDYEKHNIYQGILPSEAHVQPTHERDGLIYDTQFLVLIIC